MLLFTNGEEEMSVNDTEKKTSENNGNQNLCKHCGAVVDENSKVCPNCGKTQKIGAKIGKIVSIIFAVLFLILAVSSIGESLLSGICFLLFGIMLIPFIKNYILKLTDKNSKLHKLTRITYIVVLVVLFIVGGTALPESDRSESGENGGSDVLSAEEKEEEFKRSVESGVSFYILRNYDAKFNYAKISTIDIDNDTYTAYGKVKVTDNYGDIYIGNFTAVYEFDHSRQKFIQQSLEVGDLIKN